MDLIVEMNSPQDTTCTPKHAFFIAFNIMIKMTNGIKVGVQND